MTERQAWLALAGTDHRLGLCSALYNLRDGAAPISDRQFRALRRAIREEVTKHAWYLDGVAWSHQANAWSRGPYGWPLTPKGNAARIAFCKRQAARCAREAAKRRKR